MHSQETAHPVHRRDHPAQPLYKDLPQLLLHENHLPYRSVNLLRQGRQQHDHPIDPDRRRVLQDRRRRVLQDHRRHVLQDHRRDRPGPLLQDLLMAMARDRLPALRRDLLSAMARNRLPALRRDLLSGHQDVRQEHQQGLPTDQTPAISLEIRADLPALPDLSVRQTVLRTASSITDLRTANLMDRHTDQAMLPDRISRHVR